MNTLQIEQVEKVKEIESLRTQLTEMGVQLGLHHPKTIQLSEQLDSLLNKYEANKHKIID